MTPSVAPSRPAPWIAIRDRETGRLLIWSDPSRDLIEVMANVYSTTFRRRIKYRFLVDLRALTGAEWVTITDPALQAEVCRYHPRDRMVEVGFERYGQQHTAVVSLDVAHAATTPVEERDDDARERIRIPA